jgi:hypothetical protein
MFKMQTKMGLILLLMMLSDIPAMVVQNLGLTGPIRVLQSWENYLVAQDQNRSWGLFDLNSNQMVRSGLSPEEIGWLDFAGGTLVVPRGNGLEIYSVKSGKSIFTDDVPCAKVTVSEDGKWVGCGTATEMSVWSNSGQKVVHIDGFFKDMEMAIDSGLVYAAQPGSHLVPIFNLSDGSISRVLSFQSAFQAWLEPAKRFLAVDGDTVESYSIEKGILTRQPNSSIRNLGGVGHFYWNVSQDIDSTSLAKFQLNIYKIDSSTMPFQSFEMGANLSLLQHDQELAWFGPSPDSMTFIRFHQDSVAIQKFQMGSNEIVQFERLTDSRIAIGYESGVIEVLSKTKSPIVVNHGRVVSTAATSSGLVAISLASGRQNFYKSSSEGFQLYDSLQAHAAIRMLLTDDGRYLVSQSALSSEKDSAYPAGYFYLSAFHVPSHRKLHAWKIPFNSWKTDWFDLSSHGNIMSLVVSQDKALLYSLSEDTIQSVGAISIGVHVPAPKYYWAIALLSPNGDLCATVKNKVTYLYRGTELVRTFPGIFASWYDSTRFILNYQKTDTATTVQGNGTGTWIVDTSGHVDSSFRFPSGIKYSTPMADFRLLVPTDWPSMNSRFAIYNLKTGETDFESKGLNLENISFAGDDWVIYTADSSVHAEKWKNIPPALIQRSQNLATHKVSLRVLPNLLEVTLELNKETIIHLQKYSLTGHLIFSHSFGKRSAGSHRLNFPISNQDANSLLHRQGILILKGGEKILSSQLWIPRAVSTE